MLADENEEGSQHWSPQGKEGDGDLNDTYARYDDFSSGSEVSASETKEEYDSEDERDRP
jgi:hypothetical protein